MKDQMEWLFSNLTFGDLLKYLRVRAQLSQKDLSIAVGYSEAQISRLESNKRPPNPDTLRALFIPALGLEDEPEIIARLLALAEAVRETGSLAEVPIRGENWSGKASRPEKRHNLPVELTSLVGRESDLAEVGHLLELPTTRLLTLTGAGGCGKTRLALRAGRDFARRFPNGAWLVELAPLSDPFLVPHAVVNTLGLSASPDQSPIEILTAFLHGRDLLLILDNCEHLIEAAAQLATGLLSVCPDLKILATSREPLNMPGEITYRVPSLGVPPANWDGSSQISAAAQLFLERAASVQPGYALAEGEGKTLARICQRLDGIPLAIELAAVRVSVLTVGEIAARLEEGFHVLGSGSRGRVPRHATLHATVEWSYNLLSEPERVLLRHLSFFTGGWLLEQAEEVCSCGGLVREDVLDLLVALVSKSLVSTERQLVGGIHFRLHEMV